MAAAHDFLARRPHLIPSAIAAAMLLAAMWKWPYDYYTVMRLAVCGAAVFVAYKAWTFKRVWGVWAFGFVTVLFNPLVPVHFERGTWQVIDLAAAAMFIAGVVVLRRPTTGKASNDRV